MNNNQLNRIQFNDNNNIEIKQDNLNQAYQPPEVAAATIQKRFQLVQALKKQDFEEDDILDEEYDKLNMISDNKIENQLKQERNDINIQDQIVNDMYQQVISESTFILLQNILNELNRFSVKDLFLKFYSELESFYQNTEQKIYKYLNTFVIDRLLKNFQLLLRFDLDYQLLIKKYLHFVYQNVKYDEKRMKFDINLYFYKKDVSDEKSQQLNPQNWIYLPQQCLQSYLERLQSLVKQAFQNFYNSPFETLIEEGQEVYSLYDLNQPQNRLFEKTQLGFVHSIRKSIELTDFQINSQDKQNLIELLNQFFIKYNENDQNKIELLILYKKIEILYKRVINGPIEDFKDQINSLMIKNIKSYIDQINDYKQNIELSELQEPIIEFVNTYYLDYQINAYLNKIKKIIGEYKQIKSKQSEIKMETSQTYIQEILNFVSNQFIVSFKEILTKSTVKTLIQYLKENKFTQAQQNLIQKKELTLLLCKQIGQKVYPNEFKKQPSQMSMTSIQSDFNYYYEEKKSNQNSLENSSKRQEDRGNQQNMMNQDNSSFSQNIFKNKNLLRLEEKTVFQENSRDEEFNYEKKEIQDFNKFLQKFNQECQLENHSYEILQNLNEKSKFSSNNHYVIIFLETNYFLIIRPSTKQAKIIVNTQINKQPGYFNQIVTDLSLYYEKLNMRPISQSEFEIFKYLIQKQIFNQKAICFSGLIRFIIYYIEKNQNQQLSLKEQFELLQQQFQNFNQELQFVYKCQNLYNLQVFGNKVMKYNSNRPIENQDGLYYNSTNKLLYIQSKQKCLLILDNHSQFQQHKPQNGQYQIDLNDCIEVHLLSKVEIENEEMINLIMNSDIKIIQILISMFGFNLEKDENKNNIFLTNKLRENILSIQLQFPQQLRYSQQMSITMPINSISKIKLSSQVMPVDLKQFKSRNQLSNQQIFENVIAYIINEQRESKNNQIKYILIYDFQNKNIAIFNCVDLGQYIFSSLLILFEGFSNQTIINHLKIDYSQNAYILNVSAQDKDLKSFNSIFIESSINKAIQFMQKYYLKDQVFSLLLRDIISQKNNFNFNN